MDKITAILQPSATVVAGLSVGQGPAGPGGPQGPRGDAGVRVEHQQDVAATEWVVNHNLGYKPSITVVSVGGLLMLAEVLHTSLNQVRVYFDNPVTGTAICS